MVKAYKINLEEDTIANKAYRRVVYTTPQVQLVLMNIPTGVSIGLEKHKNTTQFIRVESGTGSARVGNKRYRLAPGDAIVVPPGVYHDVKSTGNLKLYTIYSPPEHPKDLVEKMKVCE